MKRRLMLAALLSPLLVRGQRQPMIDRLTALTEFAKTQGDVGTAVAMLLLVIRGSLFAGRESLARLVNAMVVFAEKERAILEREQERRGIR